MQERSWQGRGLGEISSSRVNAFPLSYTSKSGVVFDLIFVLTFSFQVIHFFYLLFTTAIYLFILSRLLRILDTYTLFIHSFRSRIVVFFPL